MDEQDRIYGTTELTPAVIRNARFPAARDGGYEPAAVHAFLEDVASAMDVLGSADAAAAIRRELQRTSDASSRVLLAGQDGAERLRAQASADAQAIIEEAKRLTDELRDAARQETARTREHIADLRGSFIEELRDMYDRIGATLYRFETASRSAADEGDPGAAPAPGSGRARTRGAATSPDLEWSEPPAVADWSDLGEIGDTAEGDDFIDVPRPPAREPLSPRAEENPELKPAWTQLADGAWDDETDEAVIDVDGTEDGGDEPLGEGEPLVDLRAMREESAGRSNDGDGAPADEDTSWLMPDGPAAAGDPTEVEPGAVPEAPTPAPVPPPDDDQRAEAMIAGLDEVLAQAPEGDDEPAEVLPPPPPPPRHDETAPVPPGLPPEPEPSVTTDPGTPDEGPMGDDPMGAMDPSSPPAAPPVAPPPGPIELTDAPPPSGDDAGAAPDPDPADDLDVVAAAQANHDAVRQFVLTSLSEGQPREAIENYLRESLGFEDAGGFIDESLQQG